MMDQAQTDKGIKSTKGAEERPPIFDERNRPVWDQVRRLLIWILRQLDHWYGWRTFENK